MSFDFGALDPERSVIFLPMDGAFRQDDGPNLIVDGGMEDLTPTAYVAGLGADLSKQGSAYAGLLCLRVTDTGAGAPYARQSTLTLNETYSLSVQRRGTGARIGNAATWIDGGAYTGGAWDLVVAEFIAVSTQVRLYSISAAYAEFDELDVRDHPMTTRSLSPGSYQGYAILGDGHTAASLPEQRPGHGMIFDGSDYIDCGDAVDFTHETGWSVCVYCEISGSGTEVLWSRTTTALSDQAYLSIGSSDVLSLVTAGGTYTGSQKVRGQHREIVFTMRSGLFSVYVDGVLDFAGHTTITSVAGARFYFGSRYTSNEITGTLFSTAVYPFALNPAQVLEWDRRAVQLRNV